MAINDRQLCDIELIFNGAFDPLVGFLDKKNFDSVLKDMRLENGMLWPIPITLDVTDEFVSKISGSEKIVLRDKEGFALAILTIEDIWKPDLELEADCIFASMDVKHPGVSYLLNQSGKTILVVVLKKYLILFTMTTIPCDIHLLN